MVDGISTDASIYDWLRLWARLESVTKEMTPAIDRFTKAPSEKGLVDLISEIQRRGSPSLLFEDYTARLWIKHRAKSLGIWKGPTAAPAVFFEVHDGDIDKQKFLRPAIADFSRDPFRARVVDTIRHFVRDQKVIVVFSHMPADVRRFVGPQLAAALRSDGMPSIYMRAASKAERTLPADLPENLMVPQNHMVLTDSGVEDVKEFIKKQDGAGVYMFDLLGFGDWVHYSPKSWMKPYANFIKHFGSRVTPNDSRAVFFVDGNIYTYKLMWKRLNHLLQALGFDQPNYVGVMINPQLMNTSQAADHLEMSRSDAELLATRVPLITDMVVDIRLALAKKGMRSFDEVVQSFVFRLPPGNVLINSGKEYVSAPRTALPLISPIQPLSFGHTLIPLIPFLPSPLVR